jgi:hypothetical protein
MNFMGIAWQFLLKDKSLGWFYGLPTDYTAPDAGSSDRINEKVDVFAYGVIVLEIVTGKTRLSPRTDFG